MSSDETVTKLSKYIITIPRTKITLLSIVILTFITGVIGFLINNSETTTLENIFYGGASGFVIYGISGILMGSLSHYMINAIKDSNYMKLKHSMCISLILTGTVCLFYLIGCIVSVIFKINLELNFIIFGCVVSLALMSLILWSISNIGFIKSIIIAIIHPTLVLSILLIVYSLSGLTTFSVIAVGLKIVISAVILLLAIYSFVVIIESPLRKNFGLGALELVGLLITQISTGSHDLEKAFEEIGEPIDTLAGIVSFKGENGVKSSFISPCLHPGPLGSVGGGNMPTVLANKFDFFTMVAHGPSTHDFNPVSESEIDKVEKALKKSLETIEYTSEVHQFTRVQSHDAKIGVQVFGDTALLLVTFAPEKIDDIEFAVGLSIMNLAKSKPFIKKAIVVDCHNSFVENSGKILAGHKEVFHILDAVESIEETPVSETLRMGCSGDNIDSMNENQGIGESGVKVMVIESNNEKTAYILLDSNNMVIGFRDKILKAVYDLGIDNAEVMTTDTHSVNKITNGSNPVGLSNQDGILEYILENVKNAIDDLEPVEVGCDVVKLENINTFGPNNSTELVSTVSSVVAVSKLIAPIIFVIAIILVIIWLFFL